VQAPFLRVYTFYYSRIIKYKCTDNAIIKDMHNLENKKMKILVFGAGAIGSLFAGLLAQAGNDVTLIGRDAHVAAIKNKYLKIEGAVNTAIKLDAHVTVKQSFKPDLIIITTKSYDTEKAMQDCKPLLRSETRVLSLQNGLGNEGIIAKYCAHVIGGVTNNGAVYGEAGRIIYTAPNLTKIGNYEQKNDAFVLEIAKKFQHAGLNTVVSEDIKKDIFTKLVINGGINGLAAIANVKNGELLKQKKLKDIFVGLIEEATAVGRAKGVDLADDILEQAIEVVKKTEETINSTLQDIRNRKTTELAYINGKIVEYGKEVGVQTPLNNIIVRFSKTILS
jgi:2-dehydropantoate 2-reductase